MENLYNKNIKTAEEFFGGKLPLVSPVPQFEEALRASVLQHYTNYYNKKVMKESRIKSFFSNKFAQMAGATFVLGIFFALAFVTLSRNSEDSKNNKMGAEIAYSEGDMEIKSDNGGWNDITADQSVKEGSSLRVNGTGRAIINLDDGSAVRINADSSLTLTSLDPKHIVITNDSGDIYTRVVKSERTFEVVANGVTYQSQGTAYKTINRETIKGVEVYESSVKVLGVNENNEVLLQQGQRYFIINVDAPQVENKVIEVNPEDLRKDEFVLWNKEQDKTEFAEELGILTDVRPAGVLSEVAADSAITLTAAADAGGIVLNWDFTNLSNEKGVKVLKSWNANPTFGVDAAEYVADPNVRSLGLEIQDAKVYHFRVCRYTGDSCDVYSNDVEIKAPDAPVVVPTNYIYLNGYVLKAGKAALNWSVAGIDVDMGYKVVWSTSPYPVYPGNEYQYLSDPSQTSTTVGTGSGTYYFRVCQYLGGSCGAYSNQIVLSL